MTVDLQRVRLKTGTNRGKTGLLGMVCPANQ